MLRKSILIFTLILFLLISSVSAEDQALDDNSDALSSEIIVRDNDIGTNDENALDSSDNQLNSSDTISDSNLLDSSDTTNQLNSKSKLQSDEGEYIDVSDAYTYLNEFRTEENVWQLNSDDTTKTYFNRNGSVWLLPLVRDIELENTAKIRAKEISEYFSHYRPDGTICFKIFPEGLDNQGENIAEDYVSCWDVTEGWKETDLPYSQQGHRRNMLDSGFNCVGIAAYKINGRIYWVQNFGLRNFSNDFDSSESFYFENNVANPEFRLEVPIYANGTFTVFVDGKEVKDSEVFAGKSSIRIYGLAPGSHNVELSYSGDYNYKSVNKTQTITVLADENLRDALPFSYLNTLIQMAEGELKLENDYKFNDSLDADFKGGIPINNALIIDGQGHAVDANALARIFLIDSYDVVLKNISLFNGHSDFSGGAIYSRYQFSIKDSVFINNSARFGGAVCCYNFCDVSDSVFINNSAIMNGGALYNAYIVNSSNFTDNYASNLGGAIYSESSVDASESIFKNNSNIPVYGSGGFYDSNCLIINDDYFDLFANATIDNGIVTLTEDLNASQTVLINGSNVVIDGNGHTIDAQKASRIFYITGNNVTIKNIKLINGHSLLEGAAIYASFTQLSIVNATFENNTAAVGGAINLYYTSLDVENSTFINNTGETGGAILSENGIIRVNGSVFNDNNVSEYGGGAIYTDSDLYIENSTFTNNQVPKYGGAIFAFKEAKTFIKDSIFSNNTSFHYGGAISCMDLEIQNSTFANNSAIDADHSHGLDGLPSFIISTAQGGAITSWGNVLINGSRFINNTAEECGVLYLSNSNGNLTVLSSEFTNNTALLYGGVMEITTNALLVNSTFTNNTAKGGSAGAVMNYQNLTIRNSSFINNSALSGRFNSYAGAVCNNGDNLLIDDSSFINNSAYNGGAVYNHYYGNLSIGNSTFADNNATDGGAIFQNYDDYRDLGYGTANVDVKDSRFINNTAQNGGAICNGNTTFKVINSNFTDNNASSGGSIKDEWGTVYLINSTIRYSDETDAVVGKVNITTSKILENGEDVTLDYINHNRTRNTTLGISVNDITVGGVELINFTLCSSDGIGLNASIEVYLGENLYDVSISNGIGFLRLDGLSVGNYTVSASFAGNSKYNSSDNYEVFTVRDIVPVVKNTTLAISVNDITVGGVELINFTLCSSDGIGLNETIEVYLGDYFYDVSISNGIGFLRVDGLSVGNYIVSASFAGNSKYNGADNYAIFDVIDTVPVVKSTVLTISTNDIRLRDIEVINFTLVSSDNIKLNGNIALKIGTKSYNVTVSNGKASLILEDLSIGTYDVKANFAGDSNYNKSSASAKFSVSDVMGTRIIYNDMDTSPVNVNTDGRIGNYFVVKLVDSNGKALAGLPIKIGFNGKIYDRFTSSNGMAKLQINLKREDIYTFAVCFLGDDDYNGSFEVAKITVDKKYPKPNNANESATGSPLSINKSLHKIKTNIIYEDMKTVSVHSADGRIGEYFVVKLVDSNGKALSGLPIKIGFNGKIYDRNTSSDGSARLQINLPRAGLYTFAIGFLPDSKYQGSFAVAKINVTKQSPKLAASAKTFKSNAKTKSVSATLKTAKGNPIKNKKVVFTINGKKYSGTTNSKGVASVKISLSKKGSYTCTAKYGGDNVLKATSKKFNVKIV